MNFKSMCERYVEMSQGTNQIRVRRKIWPPNIHLLLGMSTTPMAVVKIDEDGGMLQSPTYMRFGMSLIMNGETAVFGWCPSIDDVMGQDWMFIEGGR
jgi:hypothetical protein